MKYLTNMNLTKTLLQISKEKTEFQNQLKLNPWYRFYDNIHSGRKLTPFHVVNSVQIYKRCHSKEFITSFNRRGLCISYQPVKQHQQNLARHAIVQSNTSKVPLTAQLSPEKLSCSI